LNRLQTIPPIKPSIRFGLFLLFAWHFAAAPSVAAGEAGITLSGKTMGTTYQVKIHPGPVRPAAGARPGFEEALHAKIRSRLDAINRSMSVFMPESEISRFNMLKAPGESFPVSDDFLTVMQAAQRVYRLTEGAWDGTVKPLVDLWGFGASRIKKTPPKPAEIREAMATVGFHQIRISDKGYLIKEHPRVTLDLASIAKGYGVDALAALLRDMGIQRFLVEIGGEVYASGRKPNGDPWRIGINEPKPDAPANRVRRVVALRNRGLATSGDYRNFFMQDGVRYSHVIDPRTGYPVQNGVVSASVTAESCTLADALATALMVMGPEHGIRLIEGLPGVECLIIVQQREAVFKESASRGFYEAASD